MMRINGLPAFLLYFTLQNIFANQWKPDYYCQDMNGHTPQIRHALKEMPKLGLQGHENVLDVGCGDGKISKCIATQWLSNGSIHGIDSSSSMIAAARQYTDAANISFEHVSLFSYKPAELYDAVVCFWVLYLCDNYQEALTRVMACLKPHAKALICHIIDPGTPFLQAYAQKIAPKSLPFTLPTLETIAHAISMSNARINYLEVKYNYDHYPDVATLMTCMHKIPCFPVLGEEKEAELYTELSSFYPAIDGSITDYSLVVCMVLEKQ